MEISYTNQIGVDFNKLVDSTILKRAFIIVDEITRELCLPLLKYPFKESQIIVIPQGDDHKTLESAQLIWSHLLNCKADRNATLIALGGGMICDLTAFCASIYKRGIKVILIPTTLLSMIDACYGGKTGVNYLGYKNIIGSFYNPEKIIIDKLFLKTVTREEFLSGFGEVIKSALIGQPLLWDLIANKDFLEDLVDLDIIMNLTLSIKKEIVQSDPKEEHLRKILNFGHTIGHAIESLFMDLGSPIPHGICVVYGIITENYISKKTFNYSNVLYKEIKSTIIKNYKLIHLSQQDIKSILGLIRNDKKNSMDEIKFILLQKPFKPLIDVAVSDDIIMESLNYLNTFWNQ
jgi:3-dehydroquinate synthase